MKFEEWGLVDYEEALARQRAAFERVIEGGEEVVVFCEHPPVFTIGKNGDEKNILSRGEALQARGARIVRTDRGGDVTFHGPGQLVCYPILRLGAMGLREYIHRLEQAVIDTLAEFGIDGVRTEKGAGVWVGEKSAMSLRSLAQADAFFSPFEPPHRAPGTSGLRKTHRPVLPLAVMRSGRKPMRTGERPKSKWLVAVDAKGEPGASVETKEREGERQVGGKICAVGVRASRGGVMHGLALNVTTDLAWFEMINPCGMPGEAVAKMGAEMGEVKEVMKEKLLKNINYANRKAMGDPAAG